MGLKDAGGMANCVDPGQTAPWEQSDLGLHYLDRFIYPNTSKFHGTLKC